MVAALTSPVHAAISPWWPAASVPNVTTSLMYFLCRPSIVMEKEITIIIAILILLEIKIC